MGIVMDRKTRSRISEVWDLSSGGIECYSVKFKNVDGAIFVGSKIELYGLFRKSDSELQEIANCQ